VTSGNSNQPELTFDDRTLVRRAQAGQMADLGRLIARYQDRIYNLAYRLTGDQDNALDVVQQTFLKCVQSLATFRGKSGFYTWLVRILINTAHDMRRKETRQRSGRFDQQVRQWLAGSQAEGLLDDNYLETKELEQIVWQMFEMLLQHHQQILLLKELEGFDYNQISKALDIPIGTVKSRLHRAREALRELLLPYLRE